MQRKYGLKPLHKKRWSALLSLVLIAASSAGAWSQEPADSLATVEPVSIDRFVTLFNQETGTPRLILLTTPT